MSLPVESSRCWGEKTAQQSSEQLLETAATAATEGQQMTLALR